MKYEYFKAYNSLYNFVTIIHSKMSAYIVGIDTEGKPRKFSFEDVTFLSNDQVVAMKLKGEI